MMRGNEEPFSPMNVAEEGNNIKPQWSEMLHALAKEVGRSGWNRGMVEYLNSQGGIFFNLLEDEIDELTQGRWVLLLGDVRQKKILSIDANLGATAIALNKEGAHVVSLQPSLELGKAVAIRARESNRENLSVAVGDLQGKLPFVKGSFDVVCLHRVNSVADIHGITDSGATSCIASLLSLVAENGFIYVSGSKQSLGDGWKWDTTRVFLKTLDVLKHVGWRIKLIVDFQEDMRRPYSIRADFPFDSILPGIEHLKFIVNSRNFGIIASRGRHHSKNDFGVKGIIKRLWQQGYTGNGFPKKIHLGSMGVSNIITRDHIIRIPQCPAGVASCLTNQNALWELENKIIPFVVPKTGEFSLHPFPFFVEERLSGRPINEMKCTPSERVAYMEQGIQLLSALNKNNSIANNLDEKIFDRYIGNVMKYLLINVVGPILEEFKRVDLKIRQDYLGIAFPLALGHGDFKTSNFLVDNKGKITGVIDWDRYSNETPAFVDCLLMLGHDIAISTKRNWILSILYINHSKYHSDLARRYMLLNDIDPRQLKLYIIVAIFHILKHDGHFNMPNKYWQKEILFPFLNFILD